MVHLIRKPRWVIKRYRSSDPKNNGPLLPRDLLRTYAQDLDFNSLTAQEQYHSRLEHCSEQNDFLPWKMEANSPLGFVVADEYFKEAKAGTIIPIQGEIDSFTYASVLLKNNQRIDFDAVIFCTGYQQDLSFLSEDLQCTVHSSSLYEDIFPEDVDHIAFIGMYPGARGAAFPVVQLQAELACLVFSQALKLPPREKMKTEMSRTPKERSDITYLNALAEKLGTLPDYGLLNYGEQHMLTHGAFTPARFLLTGKHNNKALALDMIAKTETLRRALLHSKDPIKTLATLCSLRLASLKRN